MGLASRVAERFSRTESRYPVDQWISDYLLPSQGMFGYNGHQYAYGLSQLAPGLAQTWSQGKVAEITNTLPAYSAALRACPPAFAAQMVRALVLSGARFTFRNRFKSGHPQTRAHTFGTPALTVLEHPAPSMTRGELISRMEWHAGLAGNAYVTARRDRTTVSGYRLKVLRPDWVGVVLGSDAEPDLALDVGHAMDAELVGYAYSVGGLLSGQKIHTILPRDMAHWAPLPDPELAHIGMSWLTPALRDLQADRAATETKLMFFRNSATPNLVVKGIPATSKAQFDEYVEMMEGLHAGVANAFRTLYLVQGSDATVVGSNFRDMDLKAVQGASETRIAMLSRVPAPILQIAEGLQGASLNVGNFGMARRIFADTWVSPSLQDLCGALAPLVKVPRDAELWFDIADIPLLRDDEKDLAEIIKEQMSAAETGMRAGWKADAVIDAIEGNNIGALRGQHTGLQSVQMQKPGADSQGPNGGTPEQPKEPVIWPPPRP